MKSYLPLFFTFFFLLVFSIPVTSLPVTIYITGGEGYTVHVSNPNDYFVQVNISQRRLFSNDSGFFFSFPCPLFTNASFHITFEANRLIWLIYVHVVVQQQELTRVGLVIRNNVYFIRS